MFAQNPVYVAYESLLKRLHRLIAEGKGDAEEADTVREAMERPFQQLSQAEQVRLNNLSGDLYQLQDDEVYEPVDDPAERIEASMRVALNEAFARKDWEALLSLLRKGPDYLAPHQLAFLRASAFNNLGHVDTALLFMQYASEKEPQNAFYKADVLRLLCDLDRAEEAVAQAYYCISDMNSAPNALILSALVLYSSTQNQSAADAGPIYLQVVEALDRALHEVGISDVLARELISDAYVLLGYVHDALGQHLRSHLAYTKALSWDETSAAARDALDLLAVQPKGASAAASSTMVWREPPLQHIRPLPRLQNYTDRRFAQMAFAA